MKTGVISLEVKIWEDISQHRNSFMRKSILICPYYNFQHVRYCNSDSLSKEHAFLKLKFDSLYAIPMGHISDSFNMKIEAI